MSDLFVHPQFLLSLTDQFKRYKALIVNKDSNVPFPMGVVLGTMINKPNEITSLFVGLELSVVDQEGLDQLRTKMALVNDIYGKNYLTVVGLYTINVDGNCNLLNHHTRSLIQTISHLKNESDSLSILEELQMELFTVTQYSETEHGFILNIYDINGKVREWSLRSTNSEEAVLNTLRKSKSVTTTDNTYKQDINDLKRKLESLDEKLGVMIDLVSRANKKGFSFSNLFINSEIAKIVTIANDIQRMKEILQNDKNSKVQFNDLNQMISAAAVCTSALKENLKVSSQLKKDVLLLDGQ